MVCVRKLYLIEMMMKSGAFVQSFHAYPTLGSGKPKELMLF